MEKRHFSIKSSKIVSTGEIHYWSRSRQELWHKGATSGHIQKLKKLYYDCDRDVILVKIEQVGDIAVILVREVVSLQKFQYEHLTTTE